MKSKLSWDWAGPLLCGILFVSVFTLLAGRAGMLVWQDSIKVTVVVDFGDMGKDRIEKEVVLARWANVVEATAKVTELEQGFVCCYVDDVWKIAGVACSTNSSYAWLYKFTPKGEDPIYGPVQAVRLRLKDGDTVVWNYTKIKDGKASDK